MKNKQILFILLSIASCSLDAFFFNWKFPNFNLSQYIRSFRHKESSLDELVNKELDKTMKETAFIPSKTHIYPKSFYEIRHNSCREAYIDTLIRSTIEQQETSTDHKKPSETVEFAKKNANKAHESTYIKASVARDAARKAKSKDALKERQEEIVKAAIESAMQTISKKPAPNKYSPVYYEIRPINNWEDYSAWEREQVIQNRRPLYSQLIYGNKPK